MEEAQLGVILRCILIVHIQSDIYATGVLREFYSYTSCIVHEATVEGIPPLGYVGLTRVWFSDS